MPAQMQPEAKFKQRLVTSFKKHVPCGWYTYIVKGPGQKDGLPDLVFGVESRGERILWVEAKMPRGRQRESQHRMLNRLANAAERVLVCAPVSTALGAPVNWYFAGITGPTHTHDLDASFWGNFFLVRESMG